MRKKIIQTLFFYFALLSMKGQDPVSSQFFFNELYMNPAFCGLKRDARVGLDYRRQWLGVPGKLETYDCWGDIYSNIFNGGLGFMASQDVSGDGLLKTSSVGIIQSFEYTIPKIIRIRAGFNVSGVQKRIDWNRLVFSDQLDPSLGNIYESNVDRLYSRVRTFADFGAGTMFDFKMIKTHHANIMNTFGYACSHLTQPDESLSGAENKRLPRRHTFHFTNTIEFVGNGTNEHKWYVSPNIIYDRQGEGTGKGTFPFRKQAQFSSFNVGAFVMYSPTIVGFFYRKKTALNFTDNDCFILFLGLRQEIHEKTILKFGYSYDFTISGISSNTLGSHEISLSVEFKGKTLKLKTKKRLFRSNIDCEDFGQPSFVF